MLPQTIQLVSEAPMQVTVWKQFFRDAGRRIQVTSGDCFQVPGDALVAPINSFGILEGGFDDDLVRNLGHDLQIRVQQLIRREFHGELPVGSAAVLATEKSSYPYLVLAPTMRLPEHVGQTLNAYLAFRAALLAVSRFNAASPTPLVQMLVVPALATGPGGMDVHKCGAQMWMAFRQVTAPPTIPGLEELHEIHRFLKAPGARGG